MSAGGRCERELRAALRAALAREFRDERLLRTALTHSSYFEGRGGETNERLEFLGDRVLGLIVAERLYRDFPGLGEDALAPRLNHVVNRASCARAAQRAGVPASLYLSPAEEQAGGRSKPTILADAAEAIAAAVYLEGGLEPARAFIEQHWSEALAEAPTVGRDPKMALQEWAAANKLPPPVYGVLDRAGPDHAPLFTIAVEVGAHASQASAGSKREGERAAAAALLQRLAVDV